MTPALARFRDAYTEAFRRFLEAPGEAPLHAAYELGREAVAAELSVLDLALVHHEALAKAAAATGVRAPAVVRAGGDFFVESLSAFEMLRRGLVDTQASVTLERRHASILRRLSGFLADASLAAGAADSLLEMLRLVAEQARELTGATACLVSLAPAGGAPATVAASEADLPSAAGGAASAAGPLDALAHRLGGPVRLDGAALAGELPAGSLPWTGGAGAWVAAPLRALDGREFGWVHLLAAPSGAFDTSDEAVVVQVAEMAAAAVERALAYRRAAPGRGGRVL